MSERWHETRFRIAALFKKRKLNREMAEELDFHRSMLEEKLAREGNSPREAQAFARQAFGDEHRWHERLTELWQFRWLENLWRDVSFGVRVLRKSPGFTCVAILTLALGIGANTAIFSLIDALLLRPLPVPAAEELVLLLSQQQEEVATAFGAPLFRAIEKRSDIFQNVFAYSTHQFQVKTSGGIQVVSGSLVSGEFFDALQTKPRLGRYLGANDDRIGGSPTGFAIVISYQFWKTWFALSPDVIGREMTLDNVQFTIVGVMPKTFVGASAESIPEIYAPLAVEPVVDAPFSMTENGFRTRWLMVAARRRTGMSLETTNAALRAASRSVIEDAGPQDADWLTNAKSGKYYLFAEPNSKGFSYLRTLFRRPLLMVFALCGAVLMLSCLNIASLLMARATAREREMATRLAIGASRRRLMQQLLIESLLLACTGAAIGLAVSPVASKTLVAMLMHGRYGTRIQTGLDLQICFFAVAIALLSALLVGILPALTATGQTVSTQLKDSAATFRTSRSRRIVPRVLLSTEIALALIVVVGAGLLATSLVKLYSVHKGFDPRGIVLAELTMNKQPLEASHLTRLYQDLSDAYSHIHGIESVSYADATPLSGMVLQYDSQTATKETFILHMTRIAPDYFRTLRIPILAGREFRWNDTSASGRKVIINQGAAKRMFPDGLAIGKHAVIGGMDNEVIGVVEDAKYEDLRQNDPPACYFAITEEDTVIPKMSYNAILRIDGPLSPVLSSIRDVTHTLAPDVPAPEFLLLSTQISESISSERMMAILAVFFAVCALLVTAIGLYGTLAYTTARRTSEIGIRMALGARRAQVAMLVFRENAVVAVIGSLAGLGVALLVSRALASQLYNTSAHDVPVMLASVAVLGFIACVASLLPALRASRIEPMQAIRHE